MYPVFLKLDGRPVPDRRRRVGGRGEIRRAAGGGRKVTVVAPEIRPEFERAGIMRRRRAFEPHDLDGMWWVVAAAPSEVNEQVVVAAERRQLFVNAVDDPPNATAYLGGVVRREGVTVAISTGGRAPALAGLMREAMDAWLPADLGEWMAAAEEIRKTWKRDRRGDGRAPAAAAGDLEPVV
jgi:uroporphyrin-III C-methyltransferase/precorrin-2 dehydrogenase/sirohydrochlorin ferrochelatase